MLTVALSHLLRRGVRLETHEAVALARELLAHPCGSPTLENIQLGADGSACCISTPGTPSVASVAHLLLTLLPAGTPNVPAPLRHAIGRGLGAVDAPPFASLREFSRALEPFAKGPGRDVLRGLLQRGARPARPMASPVAEAQRPLRPPPAGRSPLPPRPTVLAGSTPAVRKAAASSVQPRQPIAVAPPPLFRSFCAEGEADAPGYSSRRWALIAAAAVFASFTVGYAVADGLTDRRAATHPGAARVSPGLSAAAPAANDPAANRPDVELRYEIVRVPQTSREGRESGSGRRVHDGRRMP